jgi:aryl-alcohol dehydrogenase-like predicted oxidoreductase
MVARQISKIGLGCVTFGREIDRNASFVMMDHAYDMGINFFDTAAAYGNGASEKIVGEWLMANPAAASTIMVATKILPPFDPEKIRLRVAESMNRLGTKSIGLLYFHNWHPDVESKAVLQTLHDLVAEGKLLQLGASNFSASQLEKSLQIQERSGFTKFKFIQNNHNLAVSDVSRHLLLLCAQYQLQLVTYSPLGAGFLTGKHGSHIVPGSRFDLVPGHQQVYFNDHAYRRLSKLNQVAAAIKMAPSSLALAWALHQGGTSSVFIGGRTPDHIDQAFEALHYDHPDIFKQLEVV